MMDGIEGPFSLEIDYIKAVRLKKVTSGLYEADPEVID